MICRSRRKIGEQPHRRRKQAFCAVVKPKNEAARRAALQTALAEIDAKFGKGAIKKGDEIEAD